MRARSTGDARDEITTKFRCQGCIERFLCYSPFSTGETCEMKFKICSAVGCYVVLPSADPSDFCPKHRDRGSRRPPGHDRALDRRTTGQRGYDQEWRELSESLRKLHPYCQIWHDPQDAMDRYVAAGVRYRPRRIDLHTLGLPVAFQHPHVAGFVSCETFLRSPVPFVPCAAVDHIVPLSIGGARLDRENLMCLCFRCHDRKTRYERLDGVF